MEETKIQWTDATWNPFHGCQKVSEGCKFCYMYRDKERYGQDPTKVLKSKTKFREPLKWKEPKLIFTCSWSDWFIEEADQWRDELWEIIKATPHHTYQILTKRPERILQSLPSDWGQGYDNVWLGVSVESNKHVSRCKILGEVPAKVKFISAEPLIEELTELSSILSSYKFDWCIIGGESGNNKGKHRFRECKLGWVQSIITDCKEHSVKIFVKQLGTYLSQEMSLKDTHGGNMEEWPKELRIREFPFPHLLSGQEAETLNVESAKVSDKLITSLSPFKKLIAQALQKGEEAQSLAIRLSRERNMPLPTAKAYVTMVVKLFIVNSNEKLDCTSKVTSEKSLAAKTELKFNYIYVPMK